MIGDRPAPAARACAACTRRSELLASIGARLEIRARLRGRLFELLEVGDAELLAAIGSPPPPRLSPPAPDARPSSSTAICRHDARYPASLSDAGGPAMLHVRGGVERLVRHASGDSVAVCGSSRSTDHGVAVAREITRGLCASGVTVVSGLADAIGAAVQREALAVGGRSVAVLAGGLDAGVAATRRALARAIPERGCVVAELPAGCTGRLWGRMAAARVIARLATVTVVVEADATPLDLSAAHVARGLGRTLAAVPGRVTSPAARGCNELLMDGAKLVRGSQDVLALLGVAGAPAGANAQRRRAAAAPVSGLDAALRSVLERVGDGSDTPEKLARTGADAAEVLCALSRLELLGLLTRGDGGRYLPCGALFDRRGDAAARA
jgi:DNA processing protein